MCADDITLLDHLLQQKEKACLLPLSDKMTEALVAEVVKDLNSQASTSAESETD